MNERVTEDFVRDHFKADPLFSQCSFEEQKSRNPRITKALQAASKSAEGTGVGKPEFIISFSELFDFIIVIECKADASRHESADRDKYADYAVDGALLYASHLCSQFDVLAIAISGQFISEARISHFYWPKKATSYEERASDTTLLTLNSYISAYKGSVAAAHIEGLKITEKAVEYNKTLNDFAIPETERATLISAILVSLQDGAFRASYKLLSKPSQLADEMISSAQRVLSAHNLDADRQAVILSQYATIKSQDVAKSEKNKRRQDAELSANTVLRDMVADVEEHVFPLASGGQSGLDVLGKFYTEFIRYSGSDARIGLVLTPTHITSLFCELAKLTKSSIVLDPCCGTGGFLTSAMHYMWEQAGNDLTARDAIKTSQLLGVERRTDMFTHACSNMMMRGDGKSNIFRGDCFEEGIISRIAAKHPTACLMNPPYDVGPAGQLRFVENALQMLASGLCVAVCQVSVAIETKDDVVEVRRRLLSKHTLEAVMSMPHDLFHPIGVSTCVLVFRAHQPHSASYKTYFGYWRDDGYVKKKNKGRVSGGTWAAKRKDMLDTYLNREAKKGFSVLAAITAEDEWCAEAYLQPDYSTFTQADFLGEMKKFAILKLLTGDRLVDEAVVDEVE